MKMILLVCFYFLATNSFAQKVNNEVELEELVKRHGRFFPLSYNDWQENKLTYFGFYIRINVENGLVKTLDFSEAATELILIRNESLLFKINEIIRENDASVISNGVWVFPILCEMVANPKKELKYNLEEELEKLIPESTKDLQINKPILVKNYPPKR